MSDLVVTENSVLIKSPLLFTDEEIEHFAQQGYVVKRRALDPILMKKAADLMWKNAFSSRPA